MRQIATGLSPLIVPLVAGQITQLHFYDRDSYTQLTHLHTSQRLTKVGSLVAGEISTFEQTRVYTLKKRRNLRSS